MPGLLMVSTVEAMLRAFLLPFAQHFRARGWRVDALAKGVSRSAECARAFDHVWEASWSRNPLSPANLIGPARRVRRVVSAGQYDIVHVHTPVASLVTRFALRRMRRACRPAVIYTAHGLHFYDGGPRTANYLFRKLEQIAGQWTDYLVVINKMDAQSAETFNLVPPGRLIYMPGIGLDTALKYNPHLVAAGEVERVRKELGLAPPDKLLLMIAEFNPGKRHADAIRAFARVSRDSVHLAFAGTGRLTEEMKRLALRLGVGRRVHFLGFRSDLTALICASTATVLPSEREGLPRSIMESMSLGVPVVATDIRGSNDLLADGAGILVPVGNIDALARAMAWTLANPGEAAACAAVARQRIRAYDIRHILKLHEDLYSRVLNSSAASGAIDASPLAAGVDHAHPR